MMKIKQEKEEVAHSLSEEDQEKFSLPAKGLSPHPDSARTPPSSSLPPPTQIVLPTGMVGLSLGLQSTLQLSPPGLDSLSESRLLYQVRRFLSTVVKFGADISVPVGEKVKMIIFDLVVDKISISQFQKQIQDVTSLPIRPFVLPFLHTHILLLRGNVIKLASSSGCSPLSYLTAHESLVLNKEDLNSPTGQTQRSDIFHIDTDHAVEPDPFARKRKSSSDSENSSFLPKRFHHQPAPSLFPPAISPGQQHLVYPHHWNPSGGKTGSQTSTSQEREERSNDEEWQNVQVMLTCILGMVEKTQRAITILQQRQTATANIRTTEETVAAVQDKANAAIMEVKQAALEELRKTAGDGFEEEKEACLNCGRAATKTCSGCNKAKYCGPFCQQRNWEVGGHQGACKGKMEEEANRS